MRKRHLIQAIQLAVLVVFFALTIALPAAAQQGELHNIATGLAKKIVASGKVHVAVLTPVTPEGEFTKLGRVTAMELAAELMWAAPQLNVERMLTLETLAQEKTDWKGNFSDPKFLQLLAQRTGREIIVVGTFEPRAAVVFFTAIAVDGATGNTIGQVSGGLPRTPAVEALLTLKQVTATRQAPEENTPLPAGVYRPGQNGVTPPKCIHCPDPEPTDELRKNKINASLLLELIVTADGHASNVRVLRGVGHGMDEQAIKTVSAWRFTPGKLPDGTPVPVLTKVEVTVKFM